MKRKTMEATTYKFRSRLVLVSAALMALTGLLNCKGGGNEAKEEQEDLSGLDSNEIRARQWYGETISLDQLEEVKFQENSIGEQVAGAVSNDNFTDKVFTFGYLSYNGLDSYIDFDRKEEQAKATEVDQLALVMKAYPKMVIRVVITSGANGAAEDDQFLARRRALYIKNRLVEKGINPQRIEVEGKAAEGKTDKDRIELRVLAKE